MFTVVIPVCDRPELLVACLPRICDAAKRGGAAEIAIVDNGVEKSAEEIAEKCSSENSIIIRYEKSKPRDRAAAVNTGIRTGATEWYAVTDDDCLPDKNWLVEGKNYAESSGFGCFGGRIEPVLKDHKLPRWLKPGRTKRVARGPAIVSYRPQEESGELAERSHVPMGANTFIRRDVFDEYGGYDEDLSTRAGSAANGIEDAEFGIRLRSAGEKIGYCAEAIVRHPIYADRATIKNHLAWAKRAGFRESILVSGSLENGSRAFLMKTMALSLFRALWYYTTCDSAAGVCELMEVSNAWGQMEGRKRMLRE